MIWFIYTLQDTSFLIVGLLKKTTKSENCIHWLKRYQLKSQSHKTYMALSHFRKTTVSRIDTWVNSGYWAADDGNFHFLHISVIKHFPPKKPASSIIKTMMMIIFEKTNPALPGFLASRSLYFSDCVENQACLLLSACLQAVSETGPRGISQNSCLRMILWFTSYSLLVSCYSDMK